VVHGIPAPGSIRSVGKGNKPHVIPMAPPLFEPLKDYVLQYTDLKPQTWLLQQRSGRPVNRRLVEDMTKRWGERAGVVGCTPHRFRHTVATTMLDAGVDIRIIKDCLAHADLNDTMLYTRVSNPQMADAFGRLPADWTQAPPGPGL
jgi:integrase/recombinase XerD